MVKEPKMMFKRIFLFFMPLYVFSAQVELGIDRFFKDGYESLIQKKKIGIITNQTGVNSQLETTIQIFLDHEKEYQIAALFCPEHGLDGKGYAWEKISHGTMKHLPVYSLHGTTRRPTKEMLKNLDVLIYDIQDIGVRSYTYATTLYYAMEEAAKCGITVIVLDRPNPMGGVVVDGPMLEEAFRSFIGYINVPYCHGMTIGELARYFNDEYKIGCKLEVVAMKGWKREMSFSNTGLTWIPTSPNIPEDDTPYYTATTGILGELELVNIGIGYTLPFKIVGAPWIDAEQFATALNQQKLPGVTFIPFHYRPFYGSCKGKDCHGVKINITDHNLYRPLTVQYYLIGLLKSLYPKHVMAKLNETPTAKRDLFNKANGTDSILKTLLQEKYSARKMAEYQKTEREQFIQKRDKYLIYTSPKK